MIFYFLISIVFIAEIIIACTIIFYLVKFDKIFLKYNSLLDDTKPIIKDIMETYRNLSEEFLKLAPVAVSKMKVLISGMIMGQLKNAIGAFTFWLVKKEVEKHV